MAKSVWNAIIGYVVGACICAIFTIGIFNIGLKEQIAILIAIFGWSGGLTIWYVNFVNGNKKEDYKILRDEIINNKKEFLKALEYKADIKDITQINCILQELKEYYKDQLKNQNEMNKIITQIYKEMPKLKE
jgi:hypothetical protein